MTGPLSVVGQAYVNAQVFTAILATFLVNLFIGSFGTITLPSLIIPFSGFLIGIYRAVLWGLLLSPAHPDMRLIMIPHSTHTDHRRAGVYPDPARRLHPGTCFPVAEKRRAGNPRKRLSWKV